MALSKLIKQENGLVLGYHRILLIESMINNHTSISVVSYLDEPSREMEKTETKPYMASVTYETSYVENMTVSDAYDYLKTLPIFEGAADV